MKHLTCGFIGFGLIGGSIAHAIRDAFPSTTIYAYDISNEQVEAALTQKTIDYILPSVHFEDYQEETEKDYLRKFYQSDIIFLCAPVSMNNENLHLLKDNVSPDTLITDVGSVKAQIHKQVERLGLEQQFIGGHPMTGSEKSGFINAKAGILENAYYILTPGKNESAEQLSFYKELVSAMGAIPIILDYERHDYIVGAISHLPHLIAASLVNLVKDSDDQDGMMKMLAAGGFKDITRIASSSPEMWESICMTNEKNIDTLLSAYIESLMHIRSHVKSLSGSFIYKLFDESRTYRDSFIDTTSGPIQMNYHLYVDVPDKAGVIATVATLLAGKDISIKNIGIVHNREFEEGVLRIEFYEERSKQDAAELLHEEKYVVHIRS